VRCDGDAVHIDATAGSAIRGSTVDLRAIAPDHRARALGLAAAEIVDARWNETQGTGAAPSSTDSVAPARVEPVTAAPPADRPPTVAVGLGGVIERAGRPGALLAGGRLGIALKVAPLFTPVVSVDAVFGEAATDPAAVGVRSFSAAAHLLAGRATGPLSWGLGPGVHAGWVRLDGRPSAQSGLEGQSVSAAFVGPALRARIECLLGSRRAVVPFAALEGDAGLVLLPVRGLQDGGRRVFELDGPWLTLALSVGATL
jgi:hypothetical protein